MWPRGIPWHGVTDKRSRPSRDKTSLRGRRARHRAPRDSRKNWSRLRTVHFAICAVACEEAQEILRREQSRGEGGAVSTQPCFKKCGQECRWPLPPPLQAAMLCGDVVQ